jgi:hypothetical protein
VVPAIFMAAVGADPIFAAHRTAASIRMDTLNLPFRRNRHPFAAPTNLPGPIQKSTPH